MELEKIYEGLKQNYEELEPKKKELELTVENYKKMMDNLKTKLETAEIELKDINDKTYALKSAMENLELIGIEGVKEEAPKTLLEKVEEVNKVVIRPIKQPKWTRKNAKLIQKDRYDNEIGSFVSQAAAARKLSWDQSSISRFMKFSKEEQIRKKNFYFTWEF